MNAVPRALFVGGTLYPDPQVVDPARIELASEAHVKSADTSSSASRAAGVEALWLPSAPPVGTSAPPPSVHPRVHCWTWIPPPEVRSLPPETPRALMALGPRSRGGERLGLEVVAVVGSLVLSRVAGSTLTTPPSSCVPRRNLCGPEGNSDPGDLRSCEPAPVRAVWACTGFPAQPPPLPLGRIAKQGDVRPEGQVEREIGLEPTTITLATWRSTKLSYSRTNLPKLHPDAQLLMNVESRLRQKVVGKTGVEPAACWTPSSRSTN